MRQLPYGGDARRSDGDGSRAVDAEHLLATRKGLPASATWLRDLFADADWRNHPNYAGLAAFWQSVHTGIKAEAAGLRSLLERLRSGGHDAASFSPALSQHLRQYLGHLEFHHRIEDSSYFPKFRVLDERLVAGFDLLEADHQVIHEGLVEVAESGRLLLASLRSPSEHLRGALDAHARAGTRLISLLDRHLDDEEDLVIPAILKYGDRAVS